MAKNNKTRFFYVLYSDKTRVFDQSERAYYPICIIIVKNELFIFGADFLGGLVCQRQGKMYSNIKILYENKHIL